MKNKGFTLIELIAVIVLMGMILLIIFPATSRLIRSNENKKYDTYYDSVQEQLELYARTRRDELGGIVGEGCVDDKKLSDLKNYDYIKEFTDEEDVKCFSPGDFTSQQLQDLGISTDHPLVNVKITNNKGKIDVKFSMICVRNYDDPDIMSVQYTKLVEQEGTCETYVPVVTNSLLNTIKDSGFTLENKGTTSYIKGNPTNNYVWYSGKMWRIISYDLTKRTIKLVTDDIVTITNYNNRTSNEFYGSNIYLWLNNEFLSTLRNPEKYLKNVDWYYADAASNVTEPITTGKSYDSKVGMINNYEYRVGSSYLNKSSNFWLLSTIDDSTDDKAWYVNASGTITSSSVIELYGIRPSVVLKENITITSGGDGTVGHPYRLTGDIGANFGTKLNTRFEGEYVTFNGITFRISKADPKYTKLVAVNTIPIDSTMASTIQHIESSDYNDSIIKFHYFDNKYSDNTFIGNYLGLWSNSVQDKLVEGDFCRRTVLKTTSLTADCPQNEVINTTIAVPSVGDMFAVGSNNVYWTISNSDEDPVVDPNDDPVNNYINRKVHVVNINSSLSEKTIGQASEMASILPVVVVSNTVTISGGNGTPDTPYTIQ